MMKTLFPRILLLTAVALSLQSHAQNEIELIQEYELPSFHDGINYIEHGVPKLMVNNNDGFDLYNMDFTLYKSVAYPEASPDQGYWIPILPSLSLFDCDDSQLEYMVHSTQAGKIRVWREDGTVLLSLDENRLGGIALGNHSVDPKMVASDSTGTYMLLGQNPEFFNFPAYNRLYKLCGQMPVSLARDANGMVLGGRPMAAHPGSLKLFPNPSRDMVRIEYDLDGYKRADLGLYTVNGKLVKQVQLGPAFKFVQLNISDLPTGTYIARITTDAGATLSEKLVKVP